MLRPWSVELLEGTPPVVYKPYIGLLYPNEPSCSCFGSAALLPLLLAAPKNTENDASEEGPGTPSSPSIWDHLECLNFKR